MKQTPNWNQLWKQLRDVYSLVGRDRDVAVLDNHVDRKEAICRKLGVVSGADVNRIGKKLNALPKSSGGT